VDTGRTRTASEQARLEGVRNAAAADISPPPGHPQNNTAVRTADTFPSLRKGSEFGLNIGNGVMFGVRVKLKLMLEVALKDQRYDYG